MTQTNWVIVVHGGAGAMRSMGAEKEAEYRLGLAEAARAGAAVLARSESAIDAATAAVAAMEASGVFNAGHGSCLTLDGEIEVDAAVMDGRDLSYGAIAGVPGLSNAVELAEGIRTGSPHCLFAGSKALQLAATLPGFTAIEARPSAERVRKWESHRRNNPVAPSLADQLTALGGTHDEGDTVGAVALDGEGNLAAAVSTGGIWLKQPGRVGDSPLAGSGLWAENDCVACAATGTGEFIMRVALAADIRSRVQAGSTASHAAKDALAALRERFGSDRAGVIALGHDGEIAAPFDTAGMGRAWMRSGDAEPTVRVWPEEDQ